MGRSGWEVFGRLIGGTGQREWDGMEWDGISGTRDFCALGWGKEASAAWLWGYSACGLVGIELMFFWGGAGEGGRLGVS